jgi:hypothetical protein
MGQVTVETANGGPSVEELCFRRGLSGRARNGVVMEAAERKAEKRRRSAESGEYSVLRGPNTPSHRGRHSIECEMTAFQYCNVTGRGRCQTARAGPSQACGCPSPTSRSRQKCITCRCVCFAHLQARHTPDHPCLHRRRDQGTVAMATGTNVNK